MFCAVVRWNDKNKRSAFAQIERLARLPEVSFYTGLTLAPDAGNSNGTQARNAAASSGALLTCLRESPAGAAKTCPFLATFFIRDSFIVAAYFTLYEKLRPLSGVLSWEDRWRCHRLSVRCRGMTVATIQLC